MADGKKVISGVISSVTQVKIQNLAQKKGTSVSQVVRDLIEKGLRAPSEAGHGRQE